VTPSHSHQEGYRPREQSGYKHGIEDCRFGQPTKSEIAENNLPISFNQPSRPQWRCYRRVQRTKLGDSSFDEGCRMFHNVVNGSISEELAGLKFIIDPLLGEHVLNPWIEQIHIYIWIDPFGSWVVSLIEIQTSRA
jgi:hypothetical protein